MSQQQKRNSDTVGKQFCAIFIVEHTWASVLEICLGTEWLGLDLNVGRTCRSGFAGAYSGRRCVSSTGPAFIFVSRFAIVRGLGLAVEVHVIEISRLLMETRTPKDSYSFSVLA